MNERLITWVDVQQVVFEKTTRGTQMPKGLASVRSYWDSLSLVLERGASVELLRSWLEELFGPSIVTDDDGDRIALVSYNGDQRSLPVLWDVLEKDEHVEPLPWLPLFRRPKRFPVAGLRQPAELTTGSPALIAFHSFKGGVGRTTHALALAEMLASRGGSVLIVDADLEAPGISWLLSSRFPAPAVSFADVLALAHGDASENYQVTVKLVAQELHKLHEDSFYFLPAFRSTTQFEELEIRPEHMMEGQANPFVVSDLLAEIGHRLGVDYVIVDLRAGISELASGFLYDQRIHRVFVTTLSAQSLKGLEMILDSVLPVTSGEDSAGVAVIVSQVPNDWMTGPGAQAAETMIEPIVTRLTNSDGEDADVQDTLPTQAQHPLVRTGFSDRLAVLPGELSELRKALADSGIGRDLPPLLEWLPERESITPAMPSGPKPEASLDERRRRLEAYAHRLIFAESGRTWDFLSTIPLQNLAKDHSNSVPITLIIGTKGSGKTYSFLQLAKSRSWSGFCAKLHIGGAASVDAAILPVLSSKNLNPAARAEVDSARSQCACDLQLSLPSDTLGDHIEDWLREDLHIGQWRERWLDLIAWSAGFEVGTSGAGLRFPAFLAGKAVSVIAALDGLEDMFQDFENEHQATALRSLLQEVPNWLEKVPGRSLGLVVFVRQDIVERTIKQNSAQLRGRYEPYALRWNRTEALKLVKWTLEKAEVLEHSGPGWEQEATIESLETDLRHLWGKKLGNDDGKNANSAKFVTLALSDYSGRLQARDVVRFLAEAAKKSVGNEEWKDRLLIPTAIQHAVKECGRERILEIKKENPRLGKVLDKLAQVATDLRIPAKRDELKLKADEVTALESNAVLFKDGEDYYMPEFIRQGMGLRLRGGSKPKLFSLLALRNKD